MSDQKYPNLFSPITIRGVTIKNRIVAAPHSCPYMFIPAGNGFYDYSNDAVMYYGNLARGGAGIVNTGHLGVDPRYFLGGNRQYFNFFSPSLRLHQIPMIRRMSTLIHAYGAVASWELNHGGHRSTPLEGNTIVGPCDCELPNGIVVKAMDYDEMDRVCDYFADAAEIGIKAGFDMINVHGGHGWLIGHFLSPMENHRTDEFGPDTIENRCRFPRMILERIRDRVGPNVPIEMRLSADELTPGGYGIEDSIQIAKQLEGVCDIIQCSVGKLTNPASESFTFPTQYTEHGCNVYLAEAMKKSTDNIFVETLGGINDPAHAESILREGKADFVAMARSFIADPDWARKVEEGREDDIRPCIRCIRCLDSTGYNAVGSCTVNPRRVTYLAREDVQPFVKKNVAVIGGGPGGMNAAIELADKGHVVTLYEKSDKLGGRINFAYHIAFKQDIARYCEYLKHQVAKRSNIKVCLRTEMSPETIKALDYDAVVLAFGAKSVTPKMEGIDSKNVYDVMDSYGHEDVLGDRIAVIGGGQVGCETAIHLASLGKHVYVIEMKDELLSDSTQLKIETATTKFYMTHEFSMKHKSLNDVPESTHIENYLSATCLRLSDHSVTISQNGEQKELEVDSTLLAIGFRPDRELVNKYADCAKKVIVIGDAKTQGSIYSATEGAYFASLQI